MRRRCSAPWIKLCIDCPLRDEEWHYGDPSHPQPNNRLGRGGMGLTKVEQEPSMVRELQSKVPASLALLMIQGWVQTTDEIHQDPDIPLRQGLYNRFHHLSEDLLCYVQTEQEDLELKNSPAQLNSQKWTVPGVNRNTPMGVFQVHREPRTRIPSQMNLGDHQHAKLEWLNEVVQTTDVHQ